MIRANALQKCSVGRIVVETENSRATLAFEAFSHRKPMRSKPTAPDTLRVIYPPFDRQWRRELAKRILG